MIAKVVPEVIEPNSWEPLGEGMIRAVGEGVVVRHSEEVQHRVARLMAELLPDHKALADAGVGTDTPVTHSVMGLSYATALRLLLDELNLAYVIRDEVLVITTKVCEEALLTYEVYPCFDLVVRPPDAPLSRPGLDFQSLIDNIMSVVNPESWDESGGPATIRSFTNSGALVIGQTPRAHEDIAEYLRALREANR